jgi:hypothetical protein
VGIAGLAGVIASVSSADGGVSAATPVPGPAPASAPAPGEPITFHCAFDAGCPEVIVSGDPFATIGVSPAPFRGYGDPSLERDPDTGDVWLSYSWLDVLVSDPGPPPVVDFGVRTHLARSTDGGQTFTFVRAINATSPIAHPDSGIPGWTIHEVSTIAREGSGGWQSLWLTYFDPFGPPPTGTDHRSDFYYSRSMAGSPQELGDVTVPWVRTNGTSASWGVVHNLSGIPQLSDCSALTEPALFADGDETYLATSCVVFVGGARRVDLERLVLLRQEADGYSYAGELVDYNDALDLGGTRLEQADLALAQNGAILLIVTPIQETEPNHLGCVVLEVTDIATAQVRRDPSGAVVELATITGDDPGIGPGLCTYDPASQTGVLMVLHDFTASPFDLVFSLRATGVHPNGLDSDGDATADTVDTDDDNDGYWDADESAKGSDSLSAASSPEHCDGPDNDGDTVLDEAPALSGRATPDPLCAAGADADGDTIMNAADPDDDGDSFTDANERSMSTDELGGCPVVAGHDAWPPDADANGTANVGDVIQLFGMGKTLQDVGDPFYSRRSDAIGNGSVNVGDVIALFGGGLILTSC